MAAMLRWRRAIVIGVQLALIVVSSYLAFVLRFDGSIPRDQLAIWANSLFLLILVRMLVFIPFRLYQGLWRYVSIWDARNIVGAVVTSSLLFWVVERWVVGQSGYPRSVYVLDAVILTMLLGGIRVGRRIARELGQEQGKKAVLVFGAGDAGEMIVRDMKNNPFYQYTPVGFIDDDRAKQGSSIHGVPVLGGCKDLQRILSRTRPDEVLIAIPTAPPKTIREFVHALEPYKIPITTLPNLRDLLDDSVKTSQIRKLSIEDLLARPPVDLDPAPVSRLIEGKRVLVTGAGGSIGSELCRQILALRPSELVLLDRYENGLYEIAGELERRREEVTLRSVIADIGDANRIDDVFSTYRPQLVFHAAAHKHVPMMELNPCEAVKNNVLGTRCVARAADRFGVERFVMISTDKAVNPTSIMGVTKRVAEFVVQDIGLRSATVFSTVRFGNVLGSNGSVVPFFLDQIKAGGPVTVTHPEMRRFFMLIPEAVTLVLHAATMASGGEVFVLEMGEQIRVSDMARNLIRLSGYVPDEDIEIVYIGARPGEKLFEELVGTDEIAEPLVSGKVMRVRPNAALPELDRRVSELGRSAARGARDSLVAQLQAIVPTFRPQVASTEAADVPVTAVVPPPILDPEPAQGWN
jgi:FlaA1/EpsC-like NDP-sugar epimerase